MKKYLQFLPVIALAITTASCDSKARLANDISGSWASSPETLANTTSGSITAINIMEFIKTPGQNGGELTISGLLNSNAQLPQSQGIVQPISYSASGVATIQGSWTAHDDDEITVFLDGNTFNINIDPDAVVLDYNLLSGESAPDTTTLKPAVISHIKNEMTNAIRTRFFNTKKIDDIKIKHNMMSCEINDHDVTLRRQNAD